jgi:polyferredoxin
VKRLRQVTQIAVILAASVAGVRFALGRSVVTVETYCPFGGLETAYAFLTRQRFTCAAGDTNLALFIALIGLTFLARKAFCGWVCPVGALSEWEGRLAQRLFGRQGFTGLWRIPPRVDRVLRIVLRIAVLALVLVATWTTGELVFRGYDPYYILFSANGHDVRAMSYAILAGLAIIGLLLPMAWCRYLCPLGAAIWPFSAAGRLRLAREENSCTACGACDHACPQTIDVSQVETVQSGECTLCFECTEVCPSGALELRWAGTRR